MDINSKHMEKSITRLSNLLNITRQDYSVIEKKIFHIVLEQLKPMQGMDLGIDPKNEDEPPIHIKFDASRLDEKNTERIKESLERMTRRNITFEERTAKKYYFVSAIPFPRAKYLIENGKGLIDITLAGYCKDLFLELARGYTRIDVDSVLNLQSPYAIRMYELLNQYAKTGTWTVSLESLRHYLGIGYSQYKNFTLFKTRILEYSQQQLFEHCNLSFDWEVTGKNKKKITELTFTIKSESQIKKEVIDHHTMKALNYLSALNNNDKTDLFKKVLSNYSLSEKQLEYVLKNPALHDEVVRITTIIDQMEESGKPPRNKTAYLVKTLGLDKLTFK